MSRVLSFILLAAILTWAALSAISIRGVRAEPVIPVVGLRGVLSAIPHRGAALDTARLLPNLFPVSRAAGGLVLDAPTYPAGESPDFVVTADFNGDGKPDLAVASFWGSYVSILLNKGDGTVTEPVNCSVVNAATSIAVGDFNGDGKLDLAVTNCGGCFGYGGPNTSPVSILLGNGDGTFQPHVDYEAEDARVQRWLG